MRNLTISIYPRTGTNDNSYIFNSLDSNTAAFNQNSAQVVPYQFIGASLNYSLTSSSVLSTLVLSMNQPISSTNVLRSGQPIEILDEGITVFQGVLLSMAYELIPAAENGQSGMNCVITLAPSIFQLTITPTIFDNTQAQQINQLTGLNVVNVLVGGVAQSVSTQSLINYMLTNTDYSNFFMNTIQLNDVGSTVYVMASAGQSKDSVLRASLNFYNVVIYQSEDGLINIRQLNSMTPAPFNIDLSNGSAVQNVSPNETPTLPLLTFKYTDNAATTPSIISNYNVLSGNIGVGSNAVNNLLTYKPNPTFFPRVQQLANTGWFVGLIGSTQIGSNIVTQPAAAQAFQQYTTTPDQYVVASNQIGASQAGIAAYQALLTAKQMGEALTNYATIQGTISLDSNTIGNVLGTIINVGSCDLNTGLIASCNRAYSAQGSFLTFNIVPLGSLTGYWSS